MSSCQHIAIRLPVVEDGMRLFRLIQRCPPLDPNSSYCNLLQCSHFSSTSVAAELNNELVGFISGYLIPEHPETLFIWQVAVDEQVRGAGLASQMLMHILSRPDCQSVRFLETTITKDNAPSWALFNRLAIKLSAEFKSSPWLDKQAHFDGLHDSEEIVRIGPFRVNQNRD